MAAGGSPHAQSLSALTATEVADAGGKGAALARLLQAGWTAVPAPPKGSERDGARIAAALVPRCLRSRAVLSTIAFETKPLSEELAS